MNRFSLFFSIKTLKWMGIGVGGIYLLLVILINRGLEPACPLQEHTFQGKKYGVEVCWLGGEYLYNDMRLRVYSAGGELLADRRFQKTSAAVGANLDYMHFDDYQIRYSDDTSDHRNVSNPEDRTLRVPPTWRDWMEARLICGYFCAGH
jgi:hypothetical protein